jgi:hypothetical protein
LEVLDHRLDARINKMIEVIIYFINLKFREDYYNDETIFLRVDSLRK